MIAMLIILILYYITQYPAQRQIKSSYGFQAIHKTAQKQYNV